METTKEKHVNPDNLREKVFERVFQIAEIAQMSKEENKEYEESLKVYRDLQNSLDTARMEGEVKGRAEGEAKRTREVAINGIKAGLANDIIKVLTGLADAEINQLRLTIE